MLVKSNNIYKYKVNMHQFPNSPCKSADHINKRYISLMIFIPFIFVLNIHYFTLTLSMEWHRYLISNCSIKSSFRVKLTFKIQQLLLLY